MRTKKQLQHLTQDYIKLKASEEKILLELAQIGEKLEVKESKKQLYLIFHEYVFISTTTNASRNKYFNKITKRTLPWAVYFIIGLYKP